MRRQRGRSLSLNVNPVGFIVHINRDIKMDIRAICHTGSPGLSDQSRSGHVILIQHHSSTLGRNEFFINLMRRLSGSFLNDYQVLTYLWKVLGAGKEVIMIIECFIICLRVSARCWTGGGALVTRSTWSVVTSLLTKHKDQMRAALS